MDKIANTALEELADSIAELKQLGCECVGADDLGSFGYVVEFEKGDVKFRIVKDRVTWFLDGEEDELKNSPSRKSKRQVTQDAKNWVIKKSS